MTGKNAEKLHRPDAVVDGRAKLELVLQGSDLPLTFGQQRLWFLDQLDPGSSSYTIAARRRFLGPLDRTALSCALTELVRRHESLRTTFPCFDGEPVQRIADPKPMRLEINDLQNLPAEQRAGSAWKSINERARQPFDLANGPLFRAVLMALGPEEHDLLLVLHHIVADGWSVGVLDRELMALYGAFRDGETLALGDPPLQYGDYALWQRQWLAGDRLEEERRYWLQQLANPPAPCELPADHSFPRQTLPSDGNYEFSIPASLAAALRILGWQQDATLFMSLLAAFTALLSRYTGQEDILVGTPIANRDQVELESAIGLFANTLALRMKVEGDPTFGEILARARETCLGAYSHPHMPFEKLVEELQPERVLQQNPFFRFSLVLQDAASNGDLTFISGDPPFDLTLFVSAQRNGTLGVTIQYKQSLFEADTIVRLAGHFYTLLEGIVAHPDARLSELPLIGKGEVHRLLAGANATATPYPRERSIHELFEDHAKATPNARALAFGNEFLTYVALDRRSNRLARHLAEAGVEPESRVGLLMERSDQMIVSLLAILKTGGAYVPLDPQIPADRLAFILEDAKISIVLTDSQLAAALPATGIRVICVDREKRAITRAPETPIALRSNGDATAYVMYTSGSTGAPKGAAVPHRAVVRLVMEADYARFGPDETFLQLAPTSFDAATFEIWGALLNGACLAIAPAGLLSARELGNVIQKHRVTTLWLTAGLFNEVVDASVEILRPLRQLLVGGDILSPRHVREALDAVPHLRLINAYGPTEGTTFTCCHTIAGAREGFSIPIGLPIANTRVYILDRYLQPVPIGVPGELWIAGDGLASGYVNQPELTAQRFIVHRFTDTLEERLYRTGDQVRWLRDGNIEFLGRLDNQVKVRGFRVELGEIEEVLVRHPGIRQAAVVAIQEPGGGTRLVASVVSVGTKDRGELRNHLRRKLPAYMLPAEIVFVDRLPLTGNGKVDRRALTSTALRRTHQETVVVPRDDIEERIAAIWREILDVDNLSVKDNFFDLGGHSLLAVRLFARLDARMGIKLPIAMLFRTPTIEGLAQAAREQVRPTSQRSLVAIQPYGRRRPVFAVPGVGGNVLGFTDLARYLERDQPFYGLQSRGLDGSEAPLTSIERIAGAFLEEIRTVQPEGPYVLMGTCMGGVVAYEMAQQLLSCGQSVALLLLLETWVPVARANRCAVAHAHRRAAFRVVWNRIQRNLCDFRALGGRQRLRYLVRRARVFAEMVTRRDVFHGDRGDLVEQTNLYAYQRYEPRPYAGQVAFFRAAERDVAPLLDRRLAWRELVQGDLEVHTVAGRDSGLMLAEPEVQVLARKLTTCIEQASDRMNLSIS